MPSAVAATLLMSMRRVYLARVPHHLASMRKTMLALIAVAFGSRCASIAHGRYQEVPVRSTPPGAAIRVDCGDAPADGGVTPATVKLRRAAEHCALTLSKEGFADERVTFTRAHSAIAFANLVPGLLVGTAVAAAEAPVLVWGDSSASSTRANTAAVGGIAAGTGIGLLVDQRTGALYRQVPGSVDAALKAKP